MFVKEFLVFYVIEIVLFFGWDYLLFWRFDFGEDLYEFFLICL